MILTGTIVNALGIFICSSIGLLIQKLFHRGIPQRFSDIIMKGIGLCVLNIALGGILGGKKPLVTILSMVLGAALGEWMDLDSKLKRLSQKLEALFAKGDSSGTFSQAFVSTTLLFCVGTMAIKGSLDSGLMNDHTTLFTKTMMDSTAACIFASSMGVGVLFSSVSVLLYQGAITLLATVAQPFLSAAVIAEMNTVGSLLLMGLAFEHLGFCHLKLMNYIPAMFLPILFCLFM